MNLALVEQMIRERIDADTAAGGLAPAGSSPIINAHGADIIQPGQRPPYLIYRFPPADEQDTFERDGVVFQVEFEIVLRREVDRLADGSAILKRLKGDAMAQATRLPSYGFHRWRPTIAGYGATHMRRVTGVTQHTLEERRYVELYELWIQEDFTG
jgi:hypothetical protein